MRILSKSQSKYTKLLHWRGFSRHFLNDNGVTHWQCGQAACSKIQGSWSNVPKHQTCHRIPINHERQTPLTPTDEICGKTTRRSPFGAPPGYCRPASRASAGVRRVNGSLLALKQQINGIDKWCLTPITPNYSNYSNTPHRARATPRSAVVSD